MLDIFPELKTLIPRKRIDDYDQNELNKYLHIIRKRKPENRFLETHYYKRGTNHLGGKLKIEMDKDDFRIDRVRLQMAPVGHTNQPVKTHRFKYHGTEVKNEWGRKKK